MMPDDLRTRIAKAIVGAVYGHKTLETAWADLHEHAQDEYLAEADAVIRELNLDISHTYRTSQGREVCIEGFWTEEVTDD